MTTRPSPPPVGTLLELKHDCVNNTAGTIGLIFHTYQRLWPASPDPDTFGIGVIFPNGYHDCFSASDQTFFFTSLGLTSDPDILKYKFRHPTQLHSDYNAGVFSASFGEGLRLKIHSTGIQKRRSITPSPAPRP